MATKKPSPAQLAARAKFAALARSGALAKRRKTVAKKNPAAKRATSRVRPVTKSPRVAPSDAMHYRVSAEHHTRWVGVGYFRFSDDAIKFAKGYAKSHKVPVKVEDLSR